MWSYADQEDEAITYKADKLSSATNPNIADSMAITILLDRYSSPVVLPNTLSQSDGLSNPTSALLPDKSSFSASPQTTSPEPPSPQLNTLQVPNAHTDTLRNHTPVVNSRRACLKTFRIESVQYASSLPHFLRNIDWMNRSVVEDVHWLLGHWDPGELDVAVALELLSMDFADETVRRLAVQRLETLSNDDVLKYLLQLVQVCVDDVKMKTAQAVVFLFFY